MVMKGGSGGVDCRTTQVPVKRESPSGMTGNRTIMDAIDSVPAFRDLRLEDCEAFRSWMRSFRVEISDLTFTNLFLWRGGRPVRIARYEGFLVILRLDHQETPRLFAPVGEGNLGKGVNALLEFFAAEFPASPPVIQRVPEPMALELEKAGFRVEEDRDNFDYVYRVSDLARLGGRKYDGKRNQIRRCLEAKPCRYEAITGGNLEDCLRLQEEWCNIRQCDIHPALVAEFRAIREAFEEFHSLDLFGGAVRIGGKIQAFAVGERVDAQTAVVHFEKANPKINGLYQVINQWFCQNALGEYDWVNREQDLGIEGLRQAKLSYHPDHWVKKFAVGKGI